MIVLAYNKLRTNNYKPLHSLQMNHPTSASAAIVCGTLLGFGLTLILQNVINIHVSKNCDTTLNQVITVSGVTGKVKYCISTKLLHGPSDLNLNQ